MAIRYIQFATLQRAKVSGPASSRAEPFAIGFIPKVSYIKERIKRKICEFKKKWTYAELYYNRSQGLDQKDWEEQGEERDCKFVNICIILNLCVNIHKSEHSWHERRSSSRNSFARSQPQIAPMHCESSCSLLGPKYRAFISLLLLVSLSFCFSRPFSLPLEAACFL